MYAKFTLLTILFIANTLTAQNVGIGTNAPHNSAKLHIEDANRGLLVPRVSLVDISDGTTPVNTPATGLLVYNNNAAVVGGAGLGFYYWDGVQWVRFVTGTSSDWTLVGNAGTNPATNFIGTTDAQDFVVRTDNAERMRVSATGDVGIGTNAPVHTLHVLGDVRFEGDFINQEMVGSHANALQSVPFTNGVFNPINGAVTSITIADGNGVNNSAVFISGFARIHGGSLNGTNSSMGGYFLILQRDVTAAFAAPTNLTYTSGICYIETPNGVVSAAIGFGGGGHVSYIDSALAPGTYYYRLVLYPNSVGINAGTFGIYERDLNLVQVKR